MIKEGTYLYHKKYGIGKISSCQGPNCIIVQFSDIARKFSYPESIGASLEIIQHGDFVYKDGTLIKYVGTNRVILVPDFITVIGKKAFHECTFIEEVILPSGIEIIDDCAFAGCRNLRHINFPYALKRIGEKAFEETSIHSAELPDSLKRIENGAFRDCHLLHHVNIPSGVYEIAYETFENCQQLDSIDGLINVMVVGNDAFLGCISLRSVKFGDHLEEICRRAFYNCAKLQEVVIPGNIQKIERSAFYGCSGVLTMVGAENGKVKQYCEDNKIHYADLAQFHSNLNNSSKCAKEQSTIANTQRNPKSNIILKRITAVIIVLCIIGGIYFRDRLSAIFQMSSSGMVTTAIGIYKGDLSLGVRDGDGDMVLVSGDSYSGEWEKGLPDGFGSYDFFDGDSYCGSFENGKRSGSGVYCWSNGDRYDGQWKNDLPNGKGILYFNDGSKADVVFKDGIVTKGSYRKEFETCTVDYSLANDEKGYYVATYTDGTIIRKNGQEFNIEYSNGDQYAGSILANGLRNGTGIYTWKSGEFYSGSWENDKMAGFGSFVSPSTTYAGLFVNNYLEKGSIEGIVSGNTYTYTVTAGIVDKTVTITFSSGDKYTGTFFSQSLTGEGTITYVNGDKYEGSVKAGLKSGSGKYTWKFGPYYEGKWKDDKMNGSGTYYYDATQRVSGTFKDNKPSGTCAYYTSDGRKYKTVWSNGIMTSINNW